MIIATHLAAYTLNCYGLFCSPRNLKKTCSSPITKSTTAVIDYIYYDYTTTMVFASENHRGMYNRDKYIDAW